MLTHEVELTSSEIILLDGKCSPKVQEAVERAKLALETSGKFDIPDHVAVMISKIVEEAEKSGRIVHEWTQIRRCPCCSRTDGYRIYKGRSKYKRKGQPDYDNPILFGAYEFKHSFVRIRSYISLGFCDTCVTVAMPALKSALESVKAEIPESITGFPPKWKRYDTMKCTECGWEGHEGQMRRLPTLIGYGTYPGGCPNCKAENMLFARAIKGAGGFALVETNTEKVGA